LVAMQIMTICDEFAPRRGSSCARYFQFFKRHMHLAQNFN
jgi:hypothetical protein